MKNQKWRLFLVYSLNTHVDNPVDIHPGKPLYFSSKENAENFVIRYKDYYPFLYGEIMHSERVYCLVLEEFELDSPYRYQLSTSVYSPDGKLLTDSLVPDDGPFYGRPEKSIHHDVGEVVEMPFGNQLVFGIILEQPVHFNEEAGKYGLTASDDCYTVIHHKSHELNYAYAPLVFKPSREVPEEVRKDLMYVFSIRKESENNNKACEYSDSQA